MKSEKTLPEQIVYPSDNRELLKKQHQQTSIECYKNAKLQRLRDLIKDEEVLKALLQEEEVKKIYLSNIAPCSNLQKQTGLPSQQLKLIRNMKMGKSSQTCTICMEKFETEQTIKKLPCGHILHRQCGKEWFKTDVKCPVCRFDLKNHFDNLQKASQEKRQNKGEN